MSIVVILFSSILFKDSIDLDQLEKQTKSRAKHVQKKFDGAQGGKKEKQDTVQEKQTDEEKEHALLKDEIGLSFENIDIACEEEDYQKAFGIITFLATKYYDLIWEGQPFLISLIELIDNKDEEFKNQWSFHWKQELDQFRTFGKIPQHAVLKISQASDREDLFQRLIALLAESENIYETSQALLIGKHLNWDVDYLYGVYVNQLKTYGVSAQLTWSLEHWPGTLLKETDLASFQNLTIDLTKYRKQIPPVNEVKRPFSHYAWKTDVSFDVPEPAFFKTLPIEYIQKLLHTLYKTNSVSVYDNQIKYLDNITKKNGNLKAIDLTTGEELWQQSFAVPQDGYLNRYFSTVNQGGHFDAISWFVSDVQKYEMWNAKEPIKPHFEIDFLKHSPNGELLWVRHLKNMVENPESMTLAGQPIIVDEKILIPLFDFTYEDFDAGQLKILALDEITGEVVWQKNTVDLDLSDTFDVNLKIVEKSVLATTGQGIVFSLDVNSGLILWINFLEYQVTKKPKRGLFTNEKFYRVASPELSDPLGVHPWTFNRGIFLIRGSQALVKEEFTDHLFLIDVNTGEIKQRLKLEEGIVPTFVRWLPQGALLASQNHLILVKGIGDKKITLLTRKFNLSSEVSFMVPWGQGVLAHTGENVYEIKWNESQETLKVKKVFVAPYQVQWISCQDRYLLSYTQNQINSKLMFPSDPAFVMKMWDEGDKTANLAYLMMSDLSEGSQDQYRDFIDRLPNQLIGEPLLFNRLLDESLTNLYLGEKEKSKWLISQLAKKTDKPVALKLNQVLNEGVEEAEAGQLANSLFDVSSNHQISLQSILRLLQKQTNKESIDKPKKTDELINMGSYKMIRDSLLSKKDQGFRKNINDTWLLSSNKASLLHVPTGEIREVPGKYLASNEDRLVFYKENKIYVNKIDGDDFSQQVWSIEADDYNFSIDHQEESQDPLHGMKITWGGFGGPEQDKAERYFVIHNDYGLLLAKRRVYCFDLTTAQPLWSRELNQSVSFKKSVFENKFSYLFNKEREHHKKVTISKIDLDTGYVAWQSSKKMTGGQGWGAVVVKIVNEPDYIRLTRETALKKDNGDPVKPEKKANEDLLNLSKKFGMLYTMNGHLAHRSFRHDFKPYATLIPFYKYHDRAVGLFDPTDFSVKHQFTLGVEGKSVHVSMLKQLGHHLYLLIHEGRNKMVYRIDMSTNQAEELTIEGDTVSMCHAGDNFFCLVGLKRDRYFFYQRQSQKQN